MRLEKLLLDSKNSKKTFCIIERDRKFLFIEMQVKTKKFISAFKRNGIKTGDVVAVFLNNCADYLFAMLGALAVGASVLPVSINMPYHSLLELLTFTKSHVIVTSKGNSKLLEDIKCEKVFIEDVELLSIYPCFSNNYSDDMIALLLPTSGTTGEIKIAKLSHKALWLNINLILNYLELKESDYIYITRTINYVAVIVGEILVSLLAGCKLYLNSVKVPVQIHAQRIQKEKPTYIGATPTLLKQLIKVSSGYDYSSIRLLHISGATLSETVLLDAEKTFKNAVVINAYGLTEAGPRVAARNPKSPRISNSVGKPLPGVNIEIHKKEDNVCKPMESGEIWIKTPCLMKGYLNKGVKTHKKIKGGWLRSGDNGYIDNDGNLFVLGRMDDVIIRNAQKIDPAKIENQIILMNEVEECIVFGVSDEKCDNKLICAVVLEKEANLTIQNIALFCKNRLLPGECPMELVLWKEIPKTLSGKRSRKLAYEKYINERIK